MSRCIGTIAEQAVQNGG